MNAVVSRNCVGVEYGRAIPICRCGIRNAGELAGDVSF